MNTRIGGQKSVAAQKGFQVGTPLSYQARARVSFGRRMMTVRAEKVCFIVHCAIRGPPLEDRMEVSRMFS